MRKILNCIILLILFLNLAGCGNADSAERKSVAPEKNNTVQQAEPEENHMAGQTGEESENFEPEGADSSKPEELSVNEETGNKGEELMKISVKSVDYEIIYELNDSLAAKDLYVQLPLTMEVEPFSNNEMTFYPPEKLDTANTPLSDGDAGSLAYYSPWGDVVMFYAPCNPNGSLYGLGTVVSGGEDINKLSGTIEVSDCD